MRTIKELLILLREELKKRFDPAKDGCICYIVASMCGDDMITGNEFNLLDEYIMNNKPRYLPQHHADSAFWWPYGELAPRLEFLDKLIAEL